jgi:hypothetical protein
MGSKKDRLKVFLFALPMLFLAMCYYSPDTCQGDGCGGNYPVCRSSGVICPKCGGEVVQSCCDPDYGDCWYEVCNAVFYCDYTDCTQAALDLNEFCSVSHCGNGVCDPNEDGATCPEDCTSTITLSITDACLDSLPIDYKFYDEDNHLVWPSANSYFETPGYNIEDTNDLVCITGSQICYGAEAGDIYWGVGLNNEYGCDDCCVTCEPDLFQGWTLGCD